MARTLGSLVLSMTIGAAVLDWWQPNTVSAGRPATELMARGGLTAREDQVVRFVPQRSGGAAQARNAHFFIDREGACYVTNPSQRQNVPAGEIRVNLLAAANTNEIAAPQWDAARRLLGELQVPPHRVIVDDTLALPRTDVAPTPAVEAKSTGKKPATRK